MNKRKIGTKQETAACVYLEKNGVTILERNYRTRRGEIDLICLHEGYLIFAEVKYRADADCGFPEEAVTKTKQRTICRVAEWYLFTNGKIMERAPHGIRYDVIAILGAQIRWIPNAFEHQGKCF